MRRYAILPTMALTAALTACGGGAAPEDEPEINPEPPVPVLSPLSGVWQGTGPDRTELKAVVLDDGQMWLMEMDRGVPVTQTVALVHASDENLDATSVKQINYALGEQHGGNMLGTYIKGGVMNLKMTIGGVSGEPLMLTPVPSKVLDYSKPPKISAAAGLWETAHGMAIEVTGDGSIVTSDEEGCVIAGALTPHESKKGVYEVDMLIGGAPCENSGQRLSGIAATLEQASGPMLLVSAHNSRGASITLPAVPYGTLNPPVVEPEPEPKPDEPEDPAVTVSPIAGAWHGALLDSSGNPQSNVTTMVLDDGQIWMLRSDANGLPLTQIQGTARADKGYINESIASYLDHTTNIFTMGSILGGYSPGEAWLHLYGQDVMDATLEMSLIPNHEYNRPARLGDVTGLWTATTGEMFNVMTDGSFILQDLHNNCYSTGSLAPHGSGKNIYQFNFTFGFSPCANSGLSASGVATIYNDAGKPTLVATAINGVNGAGIALRANRMQ